MLTIRIAFTRLSRLIGLKEKKDRGPCTFLMCKFAFLLQAGLRREGKQAGEKRYFQEGAFAYREKGRPWGMLVGAGSGLKYSSQGQVWVLTQRGGL